MINKKYSRHKIFKKLKDLLDKTKLLIDNFCIRIHKHSLFRIKIKFYKINRCFK